MNKLYLFKDQEDYVIKLTDDKVINIIGTKGSGKTTSSMDYLDSNNYVIINCDRLLELPSNENEDKILPEIRNLLKKTYDIEKDFDKCYEIIINYILDKKKIAVIEGNIISDINPKLLKGKVIIKRTSVFKSFKRAVKRDYHNEYLMNLEKEKHKYIYKLTRLFKIIKRRKSVFKEAKNIEKIINELGGITYE